MKLWESGSVSGSSFKQAVELLKEHSFRIAVATPNGATPEFHVTDEACEMWLKENRQLYSQPLSISDLAKQGTSKLFMKQQSLIVDSS